MILIHEAKNKRRQKVV